MGVPKFFRWMSERYPGISQLIAENRIPEFDCLYLDMNGIIHNCTHNDSDGPTARMTEDKMFIAIFNYIEHLFGKIKPKQLFFMAIDGVAPRAKMNQQRARRFRTALDAEKARDKAIKEGVEMPKEAPFDSNCITPGTEFMAKLTQQLKYFINKKVSEDLDWQGVEVVLSGHEVPGEGEHKIMEYIRQAKAQPEYDPNRRHCLYGLDADLIMLGLLSHDPHFCLLREEVTFGRQSKTKSKELEHQNFFLMHLCIVREYLELEFQELAEPGALGFPFDMERVIDDFILMAFFVGNDFLPNLPHLHINEGALALMFNVYKTVLPKAKGYINEGGVINMERLALLLDELSNIENRHFESENADAAWFKGKKLEREDVMEKTARRGTVVMSTQQKELFSQVKNWVSNHLQKVEQPPLDLPAGLRAEDRKFAQELADKLHLPWKTVQDDDGNRHLQISAPPKLVESDEDDEDDEANAESTKAIVRVVQKYDQAKIIDISPEEAQSVMQAKYDEKFEAWKNDYYKSKFDWDRSNEEELRKLTENYVQGLQWVLYYYYRGVASWPWFYGYHYSPMISDVKRGLKADINFKLGQPFKPYQQLMGVLPDRSKTIVPEAYHPLMTNADSPIIDFYPRDFNLDMNGKKQDWEAVVKIPFIEEDRLLKAMATKEHLLTPDEASRNSYGVSLKFTYSKDVEFVYPSSLPGVFPDLPNCKCIENIFDLPTMDGLEYYVGLMDGVKLGASALAGFPSLKVLPFHGALDFAGVNVFSQDSRNESMVVTLLDTEPRSSASYAQTLLGKPVYVGYPFLHEAKVVKVSDELFDYVLSEDGVSAPLAIEHGPQEISNWKKTTNRIQDTYSKRLGIMTGEVEALVHVEMLKGLRKTDEGATIKEYGVVPGLQAEYAPQTIVEDVISPDQRFLEKTALPIEEEFPEGSRAFYLGDYAYGRPLQVVGHADHRAQIMVSKLKKPEPDFGRQIVMQAERSTPYLPSYVVARQLNMPPLALSKLTSSFNVNSSGLKLNLGLNLKFEAKKLKVLGYSRKSANGWEYSQKAVNLLAQYMIKFPEFFAGIINNPTGDGWEDTDFYPPEIAKQKVKEIGAWLKEVQTKSFEKVPLDAEQLDSDTVKMIEQAADANLALLQDVEMKKIGKVPRNAILKPSDAEQRLGHQEYTIGDRVIYVQDSGRVPIGASGTIIGKTRTARSVLLDVVFDTTFMSGTSLSDRCSPFRGSTVPATAVLNLTNKQVVSYSTAGAAAAAAAARRPQNQSYGMPRIGAPGGPQLIPANAPPPLQGSYRGAFGGANGTRGGRGGGMAPRVGASPANGPQHPQTMPIHGGPPRGGRGGFAPRGGQANGHAFQDQNQQPNGNGAPRGGRGRGGSDFVPRGRGGFNKAGRGAFTSTDMADPTEGVVDNNPNFRPQNYSNVPPPAGLDTRGGRGRGRGRGGYRGRGGPRGGAPAPTA